MLIGREGADEALEREVIAVLRLAWPEGLDRGLRAEDARELRDDIDDDLADRAERSLKLRPKERA